MTWKDCCWRRIFTFSPDILFWTIDMYLLLFYHLWNWIFPTWNYFVLSKNEIKWFPVPIITINVVAVWPISFPKEFYCSSWRRFLSTITRINCGHPIFSSVVFISWNWFRVFFLPFWIFIYCRIYYALFFIDYFSFCWTGFNFFVSSCFKEC